MPPDTWKRLGKCTANLNIHKRRLLSPSGTVLLVEAVTTFFKMCLTFHMQAIFDDILITEVVPKRNTNGIPSANECQVYTYCAMSQHLETLPLAMA